MFLKGQQIKIKSGTYSCLDDAIVEYEVNPHSKEEVIVIEDIAKEKTLVVDISKNRNPYRVVVPYNQIA